jgi:hypothetical protein
MFIFLIGIIRIVFVIAAARQRSEIIVFDEMKYSAERKKKRKTKIVFVFRLLFRLTFSLATDLERFAKGFDKVPIE